MSGGGGGLGIETKAERPNDLQDGPDTSLSFRGRQDPWVVDGIGRSHLDTEVMAKLFEVGAITGRKFHLLAKDMNLGKVDGLLSTDFLHDYDIDLNFPAQEIRLFRQFGSCDRPKILLQGNLYASRRFGGGGPVDQDFLWMAAQSSR